MRALHLIALNVAQDPELLCGLHPLGDHPQGQCMPQVDNRLDNGAPGIVVVEPGDEAAVDLQAIQGEGLQALQRRVAGAEIVDQQLHPQRLEPLHDGEHVAAVVQQHLVGHFQLQA
ncbi:hypothetical protein BME99_17435 [Pseudomonas protegens]|nr:hypothetical protein BME99_17435 [Pseudomonas protegens]